MGRAVGATTRQGRSPRAMSSAPSGPLPNQGRCMPALRPAWASWTPAAAPWPFTKAAMRASGAMWLSDQMPRSPWVMRPSGSTAVASVKTTLAPPTAKRPYCTMCQSLAMPSSAEYWHMGEMTTRLRRVSPRRVRGLSSMAGAVASVIRGIPGGPPGTLPRPALRGEEPRRVA
jgi:hypothetical protein